LGFSPKEFLSYQFGSIKDFCEKRYHVRLVHFKAKSTTNYKVAVFVDNFYDRRFFIEKDVYEDFFHQHTRLKYWALRDEFEMIERKNKRPYKFTFRTRKESPYRADHNRLYVKERLQFYKLLTASTSPDLDQLPFSKGAGVLIKGSTFVNLLANYRVTESEEAKVVYNEIFYPNLSKYYPLVQFWSAFGYNHPQYNNSFYFMQEHLHVRFFGKVFDVKKFFCGVYPNKRYNLLSLVPEKSPANIQRLSSMEPYEVLAERNAHKRFVDETSDLHYEAYTPRYFYQDAMVDPTSIFVEKK